MPLCGDDLINMEAAASGRREAVPIVTLNRPESANALNTTKGQSAQRVGA